MSAASVRQEQVCSAPVGLEFTASAMDRGAPCGGENTANGDWVQGLSQRGTGVAGVSKTGTGVYARSASGPAGFFEGHVEVTGEIRLVGGDCAEEFCAPPNIAAFWLGSET